MGSAWHIHYKNNYSHDFIPCYSHLTLSVSFNVTAAGSASPDNTCNLEKMKLSDKQSDSAEDWAHWAPHCSNNTLWVLKLL